MEMGILSKTNLLRWLSLAFLLYLSTAKPKAQNVLLPYNFHQSLPFYFGGYYPTSNNRLTGFENQQFLSNPFAYSSSVFNSQHIPYPAGPPMRIGGGGGVSSLQPFIVLVPVNPMYQFWNPSSSMNHGIPLADSSTSIRGGGLGPNLCTNHFQDIGNCFRINDCTSHGGQPLSYCPDFSKMCCVVPVTCGQTTSASSTYFRNANWPLKGAISSTCRVEVNQTESATCVRVTMKSLTLPANTGYCDGIAIQISGGSNSQQYEPLCGSLDGKSYDVPFDSSNKFNLEITTTQPFNLVWRVNILQLPSCTFQSRWPAKDSDSGTTAIGPDSGTLAQQAPTVGDVLAPGTGGSPGSSPGGDSEITPGTGSETLDLCGVSGIRSQKRKPSGQTFRLRDQGQIPINIHGCLSPQGSNLCRDPGQANPLLQSLDWSVPVLKESWLYKFSGTPHNLDTRITYGQQTEPHEYPWAIAMYSNGRFHCGATLISDRHVLTAAHCVVKQESDPSSLNLSIGDWNLNSQTDGKNIEGQLVKIVTHPGYSTVTLKNDVAVLTLRKPINITATVRPICLPASEIALDGQLATVSGWGRDENNKLQSVLMKLSANIVTNSECDNRWIEKGAPAGIIVDTMLCMDAQFGDSCKGDSGGPAIMEYPVDSGRYIQVGIVSFGSASCTDKNLPGVYTNVGKLADWIRKQMV